MGKMLFQPFKVIEGLWDFHIVVDKQLTEGKKIAYNPENTSEDLPEPPNYLYRLCFYCCSLTAAQL